MPPWEMRRLKALQPYVFCLLAVTTHALRTQKSLSGGARSVSFTSACEGLRIGVLDLGSFAEPSQVCSLDSLAVDPTNGVVYDKDLMSNELPWAVVPHHYGTHSQPWFLEQAIRKSLHFTEDLDEADIVFVADYCYYIKWLAHMHTLGPVSDDRQGPGDLLVALYDRMLASPRWQRHWGSDFAFFDGHSGFQTGKAAVPYDDRVCNSFRNSTHMVTDKSMRNVCPLEEGSAWPWEKLLVVPYVPGRLKADQPLAHMAVPFRPLEQRDLLGFCIATCINPQEQPSEDNAGKAMRGYFARLLVNETDIMVRCINYDYTAEMGGRVMMTFPEMYDYMTRTVFCLVFPGDSASTRRFSEVLMAGCIPVIVGPPYHSLPFADDVDYMDAIIMLNITDHSPWMPGSMQWSFTGKSLSENDARFWFPDRVASEIVTLPNAQTIPDFLRGVPASERQRKLKVMEKYRSLMTYHAEMTDPMNAVNVEISGMCKRNRGDVFNMNP